MTETTVVTPTQANEGERYDMGERNPIADMIEAAAKHIGATVFWHDPKKSTLRWHATLTLDDEEVCVEACSPKLGARIESDDRSRYWTYTSANKLAVAVRRRMKAAKVRDAEQERRWQEQRDREELWTKLRGEAKEELVKALGEDVYGACLDVDVDFTKDGYRVLCRFYGNHIRADKLSIAEMVRFVTTLRMGGYDVVKMAEEEK